MKKSCKPSRSSGSKPARDRGGFTLIELVLVIVILVILLGIAIPNFAGAYKNAKLQGAARTIGRMARYAHTTAIMREETMVLVLNHDTMEIYLGAETATATSTNAADGEIDQDILERLGYVDGESSGTDAVNIEKEFQKKLPEGLEVADFEQDGLDEDEFYENLYLIRYYPNGRSDWFILDLKDQRGLGVELESDPISGKIRSEFTQ